MPEAAVVLLAALLFLPRLEARALWSSEGRWAEIAREMELSSNYFWPTINGKLYYDKPLLSYWLVLAAATITGGLNEAAARLPSALSGLLGVVLAIVLARRFCSRETALLAGFILATSYSFVFFSRNASADMETVTGELAALVLLLRHREHPEGWSVFWAWTVMAATSLTKGLLGFALPLLITGAYASLAEGSHEFARRTLRVRPAAALAWLVECNRWLFNWKTVPAAAMAGTLYYLPFWMSHARMRSQAGLDMVFRENVLRFFHPFDHRGPVYLYLGVIFALMAPWSAFLPAALVNAHGRHTDTVADEQAYRFARVYFWATLVFFTLSGSRRSYYLLPILPAAALLTALLLAQPKSALTVTARRLMNFGYLLLLLAVAAVGVLIILPPAIRPEILTEYPPAPEPVIFASFWLLAVAGAAWSLLDLRGARMALSSGLIAYLALAYLFVFAMPAVERYRGEEPFARAVRAQLGEELSGLGMYRIWAPGLVFYLASKNPIPEFQDRAVLKSFAHDSHLRWLIVRERDLAELPITGRVVVEERSFSWEEEARTRNKYLLLRLKPDLGDASQRPGH